MDAYSAGVMTGVNMIVFAALAIFGITTVLAYRIKSWHWVAILSVSALTTILMPSWLLLTIIPAIVFCFKYKTIRRTREIIDKEVEKENEIKSSL